MTAVVTADPMDVRANLIDAVGWGRRQADTAKDRKIEEIVAHERDLVVGQMLGARILCSPLAVGFALTTIEIPSSAHAAVWP